MNEDDFLKDVGIVLLFITYLVFGGCTMFATVEVTKEQGITGFFVGATLTLLLLIPSWYIGRHFIYEKHKEFFDNIFK